MSRIEYLEDAESRVTPRGVGSSGTGVYQETSGTHRLGFVATRVKTRTEFSNVHDRTAHASGSSGRLLPSAGLRLGRGG
jgi:hypothetical protein